jgi:hypothetical protein
VHTQDLKTKVSQRLQETVGLMRIEAVELKLIKKLCKLAQDHFIDVQA